MIHRTNQPDSVARVLMAALVLIALGLIVLPTQFPDFRDDEAGWAVGVWVTLANIAALSSCVLALVLIMRLWQHASARWLSVFLGFTALTWGLASAEWLPKTVEFLRFPVANATLLLATAGLVLFTIHFPAPLRREDFRYWHIRAERATPGGRFGNFLGLSSNSAPDAALPDETNTRFRGLAFADVYNRFMGLYLYPVWGFSASGLVDQLESMALRPTQALKLGFAFTGGVFLYCLVFSRAIGPLWPSFVLFGLAFCFLRVSYAVHLHERRKLLWVAEGLTLSILIPIALTYLSFPLLVVFSFALTLPLSGLIGIYPILWTSGWIALVVCLAIAIFKEGVIDPKLIIKKTVFYSALTVIIVLLYMGLAGGVGSLIIGFAGVTSQSVTIASTLAVAAVFMPVRTRVQGLVERRFFRNEHEYPRLLDSIRLESTQADNLKSMLECTAGHIQAAIGSSDIVVCAQSHRTTALDPRK